MKAQGPKHECETIIRFDEDSPEAEIWTASQSVFRRLLKRLGRGCLVEEGSRHAVFRFPRRKVRLPLITAPRMMSDSHLAAFVARRPHHKGVPEQKGAILKGSRPAKAE